MDYRFLKLIGPYRKQYEHFPLPVLLCDGAWEVCWANPAARRAYPELAETPGLVLLPEDREPGSLLRALAERGSYTLADALPFTGTALTLLPVWDGAEMAGSVGLLLEPGELYPGEPLRSSEAARSLSGSIHECVSDIFDTMDALSLKSEVLQDTWIKPGLSRIELDSYRILRVAENLTTFVQLQSGVPEPPQSTLDLAALVEEHAAHLVETGRVLGIPIQVEPTNRLCAVQADRDLLELALFNLLHNSLYYTRPGNRISIEVHRDEGGRLPVRLTIADRGLGIPPDEQERLWRPYSVYRQGGHPTGVGLGLPLVRRVADRHRGAVEMRSTPGEGTSVTMRLPAHSLSAPVRLSQERNPVPRDGRFSRLAVGLADAADSPHR